MKLRKEKSNFATFITKIEGKELNRPLKLQVGSLVTLVPYDDWDRDGKETPSLFGRKGTVVYIRKPADPCYEACQLNILVCWEDFSQGHEGGSYGRLSPFEVPRRSCYWVREEQVRVLKNASQRNIPNG